MYLLHTASAVLAESSFIRLVGEVFHPVFVMLATVLAAFYGLTASYGVAIVALTVVIMALLMPLTIMNIRSTLAMQRLQPKIARLRERYQGSPNREQLSQELMRLYREEGINPVASGFPALLQLPFLIVLYDVIKGLNNTLTTLVHGHRVAVARPRYIPRSSRMYHHLVAGHGAMNWLGINLALRPLSVHAQWFGFLPYLALILVAVGLHYVQLAQMRKRNPDAVQVNPQMQKVQAFLPILFVYFYLVIPGAVVLSMIVSTVIRIGTQHILFRRGIAEPPPSARADPGG
jgi:YidC/Oxa1 family membrane protein insertase